MEMVSERVRDQCWSCEFSTVDDLNVYGCNSETLPTGVTPEIIDGRCNTYQPRRCE